jgi:hypothetical protein
LVPLQEIDKLNIVWSDWIDVIVIIPSLNTRNS